MQTLSQIRELLAQRDLRPKHRFGQNFLHDQNQLRKLIAAADVRPGELILEVGPGTGTLTEALLEAGAEVVACEIDADMAGIVAEHVTPRFPDRLTLIETDCLSTKHEIAPEVTAHLRRPFKLVANLPYQIASPLLSTLLIDWVDPAPATPCTGMFITVQREAAERIVSGPRTKQYGVLSVLCQALAEVEMIARLGPQCFWPAPKVDSAMIAIRPRPEPAVHDRRGFAAFLQRLFSSRRKQLGGILGRDCRWPEGIDPSQRPEELSVSQIAALLEAVRG
ncbi:MAG: ribosomal RNA small subunit methyltransferase A [Phycisphaerales bacterium]|nr:ribosomal RNA small subunit methyltransferase A [Phycisphaerales bacterium]